MPRRRNADGPPAPKAPRVRKKKTDTEPVKPPEPVYDPMMSQNGMMMDDGSMYTQDYGYAFGAQPAFVTAEPCGSPYLLPPQSNTPQPMMMRGMAPPQGPGPMQQQPSTPMGPAPTALEFRIHDMNRRLYIFNNSGISEKDHAQWWDAFSHEFFDDEAKIILQFMDDMQQMPEKYVLGRHSIPKFFRSIFESGTRELYYVIRAPSQETQTPSGISFVNDNILQVSKVEHQGLIEAQTECRMFIEFTPYDEILNHRIKQWVIEYRASHEFFFNEATKDFEPLACDGMEKRITRMGLPDYTMTTLQITRILEPMQLLMSHSKSQAITPHDALRRAVFSQHTRLQQSMSMQPMNTQPILAPAPEEPKKQPRKRQRKTPANSKSKKANQSPAPTNPTFAPNTMTSNFPSMGYQDVMVVGEPSMMGTDFGEEDERAISRVENSQYDPNALQMQQGMTTGPMSGPSMAGMQGGPGAMGHQMAPNGVMVPPGMNPGAHQLGGQHPMSMSGGMPPSSMTTIAGAPSQLTQLGAPQNGHPPGGYYGQPQPGTWPSQPPNATMITG